MFKFDFQIPFITGLHSTIGVSIGQKFHKMSFFLHLIRLNSYLRNRWHHKVEISFYNFFIVRMQTYLIITARIRLPYSITAIFLRGKHNCRFKQRCRYLHPELTRDEHDCCNYFWYGTCKRRKCNYEHHNECRAEVQLWLNVDNLKYPRHQYHQ